MTITRVFVDSEDMAKAWLLTTTVANLVTVGGKIHIFQAMPATAPLPAVTLSRVGGSPLPGDTPVDQARISFQCWAANRPQSRAVKSALIGELESLGDGAVYVNSSIGGRLVSAETLSELWVPDPVSDTPRYIVEAYLYITSV